MEKVIKDGRVAVLVSPGYGAGWYTWSPGSTYGTQILFDPDMVEAVLAKDPIRTAQIAKEKYPKAYDGGVGDLVVEWVIQGQGFKVSEYDGYESLEYQTGDDWIVA